ncbi:hypothetical protein SAMN05216238_104336 [Lentibacillus persicus]|uniref:Uncharacterized protein n=2 Tax=Lentibacillus persicus TaxID=640948 RepID=A0A1I1VLX0_9BACI|nr:hypothetical protein SAMN05216238_104336 [Lentibacillus persicus]
MVGWQAVYAWGTSLVDAVDYAYVVIIIATALMYYLIQPVIIWLIQSKAVRLLNYVITSFIILLFLFAGIELTAAFKMKWLASGLHSLAIFGGCLVAGRLIKFAFRKKIKRA